MNKGMKALLQLSVLLTPAVSAAQLRGTDIPWNFAAPLVGSRVEGVGFVSGGNYAADGLTFNLGWSVSYNPGTELFNYVYTLTGVGGRQNNSFSNGPGISHFILGLSDPTCRTNLAVCLSGVSTAFNTNPSTGLTPQGGDWGPSPSNPGLAVTFFGTKFDHSFAQTGTGGTITVSLTSEHRPMWGDFYIKGGSTSYLVNNAASSVALSTSNAAGDYIAVPNSIGATTPVPEPATVALFGTGLLLVGAAARRRRA